MLMSPPRRDSDDPGAITPQGRPDAHIAATAMQGTSVPSVGRGNRKRQRPPIAPASVFGPVGRRRFWWYTYRCRICGAYLFGRARSLEDVTGERRAGCGHRVQVMAARIYAQPEPEAAA
jgi:hypothetical protein